MIFEFLLRFESLDAEVAGGVRTSERGLGFREFGGISLLLRRWNLGGLRRLVRLGSIIQLALRLLFLARRDVKVFHIHLRSPIVILRNPLRGMRMSTKLDGRLGRNG